MENKSSASRDVEKKSDPILPEDSCKCLRCHTLARHYAKGFCRPCYNEFVEYLKNKGTIKTRYVLELILSIF
jgi:hypothetical protein